MTIHASEDKTGPASRPKGVLGFLPVLQFAAGLLSAWYIVLLSEIGRAFDASAAELNWVNAVYMLATVVLVPVIAKLGDVFGHRRLILVSTVMVTAGSVLIAIAPSFGILLVGRALQAPLAAFLPLSFAIVRERAGESSGGAVGGLVGSATIGGALGGIGAGLVLQAFGGLQATLWVPAVAVALCIPGVLLRVKETTVRAAGGIDWIGASLLGIGLLLALGAFANAPAWGWGDVKTVGGIGLGVVLLVAWVFVEQRVAHPLVDMRVLTRGGVGLPLVIGFIGGAQFFGSTTATTLFALSDPSVDGFGLGFTPASAGLIVIITTAGTLVTAFLGDKVARKIGTRIALMLAGLLIAAGYGALLAGAQTVAIFFGAALMSGLGNGLLLSIVPALIVRLAPADSVGIASGLYNTARAAAGAIAGAFFAFVMAALTVDVGDVSAGGSAEAPFLAVWAICCGLSVLVALLGLLVKERPMGDLQVGRTRPSLRLAATQGIMVSMSRRMARSAPGYQRARDVTSKMESRIKLARGVSEVSETIDGVPVVRYTSGMTDRPVAVILHVHGGAYVAGSAVSGRAHSALAIQPGIDVISVDYRLAPEYPYPAGLDDALAVYQQLASQVPVAIVGESAGGGLALALVQRIRDEGLTMPQALAAVMPWADLTQASDSYDLNRNRDVLTREGLTRNAANYAGSLRPEDPRVSPLFGSFDGFPPTLVLVGTHDSLLEDARAVHRRLVEAGIETELVEVAGGAHGFVQLPAPEGWQAMARIHRFLLHSLTRMSHPG